VSLTVGPGPTQASSFFNIPSTTVKVCLPGSTSACRTISNVLVDTGSYGLRLLASALNGLIPSSSFQQDPSTGGNFIVECLPFADGYTWGPVASVDLYIGGEKAASLPINIIDDSNSLEPAAPSSCAQNGNNTDISSVDDLGANGIMGVGLYSYDCGSYCAQPPVEQMQGYVYYSCSVSTCSPTSEPLASQVINPVSLFPVDNNGVVLQLPSTGPSGETSTVTGSLIFGIGTQSNNGLGSATVLTTDTSGFIVTMFNSQQLSSSFLDSGSNGLYFPDSSITKCTGSSGASDFYCPSSTLPFSATNQGQNGAQSTVSFSIGNLNSFSPSDFALSEVGGPATSITGIGTSYFDFGVPFFYGRSVFTAIEGQPAGGTVGPYFAY
jgi:hypothetical protein